MLPKVHINGKIYFIDDQLRELRNVQNPHDAKRFESPRDMTEYLYWTKQLQCILGQTVIEAEMLRDEDLDAWVPAIRFNSGDAIALFSDEEGNGPGRFAFLN